MADVLIRGMEMPESCFECVLTNSFFRNLHCNELEGMSGFVGTLPHVNDRHQKCPLVPLPEGMGGWEIWMRLRQNSGKKPWNILLSVI